MWASAYIKAGIHTLSVQGAKLGAAIPCCQGWKAENKTVSGDSEKIVASIF